MSSVIDKTVMIYYFLKKSSSERDLIYKRNPRQQKKVLRLKEILLTP